MSFWKTDSRRLSMPISYLDAVSLYGVLLASMRLPQGRKTQWCVTESSYVEKTPIVPREKTDIIKQASPSSLECVIFI